MEEELRKEEERVNVFVVFQNIFYNSPEITASYVIIVPQQLVCELQNISSYQMKGGHHRDLNSQQSTENSGKRPFLKRGEGIARFNVPSSARTKDQISSVKGQRQTHSAPASGRSDTRLKTTPTTPTKSRAQKVRINS